MGPRHICPSFSGVEIFFSWFLVFFSVFVIGHLKLASQSETPIPYRFVAYAILAPKLHRDHDDMGLEEAAYVIRAGTWRIVAGRYGAQTLRKPRFRRLQVTTGMYYVGR